MYGVEHISSAGLHGLDQRQHRSGTSEEVDVRQGQNALGSLLLSTGLTPSDCGSYNLTSLTQQQHDEQTAYDRPHRLSLHAD